MIFSGVFVHYECFRKLEVANFNKYIYTHGISTTSKIEFRAPSKVRKTKYSYKESYERTKTIGVYYKHEV